MNPFPLLFTPGRIGPMEVPNRIVFMAHGAGFIERLLAPGGPGFWGGIYARYLAERARGGAGLVITEPVFVHESSSYSLESRVPGFDPRVVRSYRKVTDAVHHGGAKIFVQMQHASGQNIGVDSGLLFDKAPPLAPSAGPSVGYRANYTTAKELERHEIDGIVDAYGISAQHAHDGGFDGVELHLAHGYSLLHTFLSPFYNHRTDEYGGSQDNRMRMVLRVLERVREVAGDSMAVGVRLVAEDFVDGGLTRDDVKDIARRLDAGNWVDFIDVSVHGYAGPTVIPTLYDPLNAFLPYAASIKRVSTRTPVFVTGRIIHPTTAESILADGDADFIGMTRQLLADPETPLKAKAGKVDDIRHCVGVLQCRSASGPLQCVHNPAVGKEREWGIDTIRRARSRKRVVVVGGGPAGMEAARVARLRGHDVHLFEREPKLGGQINVASQIPGRAEIGELARWPQVQLDKLGVVVTLGVDVDSSMIGEARADAVIIATGSTPLRNGFQGYTRKPIPGHELDTVVTGDDVLMGRAGTGSNVVIYDTEAFVRGAGVAEHLATRGKAVRLIVPDFHPGALLWRDMLVGLLPRLANLGIETIPSTSLVRILTDSIVVRDRITGLEREMGGVDTVVLVTGNRSVDHLYFELRDRVDELYRVGDCVAPGRADRAIYDGHRVGRAI